ncbi:FadR/GntR family transcriptional regulator [Bombiscardovia coagulans]|uniref:FCD domain-containing protein n=1 Tax=Bombiscardovia coagulans TaxID=686666 RepID=A0A261ETG5_9BIFI|nr:FadR/GntR family transcriptional regulator [Bombiscardovia coagulans]OZG50143.1 FCD domain-containing protein [Bombiscardovia coagulans]
MEAEFSLHDKLLDQWGMSIVRGDVGEGDRLTIPNEGQEPPSRTVIREVTRVLESMGLVQVKRKVGATVTPAGSWNIYDPMVIEWRLRGPDRRQTLHELSELRASVEPMAAQLAAVHATPDQWSALTQAAIDMVAHSNHADGPEYLEADERFHRIVLEASGNRMFAALSDVVSSVLVGRTRYELMPRRANEQALRLHGDVAALIRQGDSAGARSAMESIVDESEQAIEVMACANACNDGDSR